MGYYDDLDVGLLVGKTLKRVDQDGKDRITFICEDGDSFVMYHLGDCCERVEIYDIHNGSLDQLVGNKITRAIKSESREWPTSVPKPDYLDSFTWTTYQINNVVIRWLGESNGYYSESVYFQRTHEPVPMPVTSYIPTGPVEACSG